ncbi:MAG: hypothetical protein A2Y02_03595 [Omnitrophica bacterium GWA2_52_12]|nr:MAG: hypothetical protein A2Y02_03595 [Omnitrophica bacterium GWA2_52_12]
MRDKNVKKKSAKNKFGERPLLTVIARITARKGKEKKVKEALEALIPPTRREKGCVDYELHRAWDNPAAFLFYENWHSKPHLDKHLRQPHLSEFDRAAKGLLVCPVEITLWKRFA